MKFEENYTKSEYSIAKKLYRLQSKTVEVLSFLKYNIEYFPKNATPSNSQTNQQVLSEDGSETESEYDPH